MHIISITFNNRGWESESGVLHFAKGLITASLNNDEKEMLLRFLKYEVGREDIPVLTNVDFGHRTL